MQISYIFILYIVTILAEKYRHLMILKQKYICFVKIFLPLKYIFIVKDFFIFFVVKEEF